VSACERARVSAHVRWCWGNDDSGQVSRIPTLHDDESVVMISAGWDHTAAITSMGRCICWGSDECDQVSGVPELNVDETFAVISAGLFHTAAITSLGRALCLGDDGQVPRIPELRAGEVFLWC